MGESDLLARIERLERRVAQLEADKQKLRARVKRLESENRRLRRKLGVAADLPPDTPRAFIKPDPRRRRKRPGSPPENERTTWSPPAHVDEEVELKPDACPQCRGPLDEPIGWEERYLVDIEPARRVTRRFRMARCPCRNCGTVVSLHVPGSVSRSHYGRRVHARVAHLRSVGIPYGKIREVLKAEYDIDLTEAALIGMVGRVARLLGPEYGRLQEEVRSSAVAQMDETTWPVDGEDQWLWCAVSDGAAVYAVEESRGSDAAKGMLGDFRGVLTHDGWTAYYKLGCPQQQCFIHINREVQRMELECGIEPRPLRKSEPPKFTRAGRPCHEFIWFTKKLRRILRDAIDFHENVKSPRRRRRGADRFQKRLDRLIDREYRDPRADQMANGLRRRRHQMFNFLRYPGVEWHSNEVEREIRPMVAFRRNCHGSKSWGGARALAVLVSVRESCRRSGRNFLELLEETLSGCAWGRPVG